MKLEIKHSKIHGRGVFIKGTVEKGKVIEICPMLMFRKSDAAKAIEADTGKELFRDYRFNINSEYYAIGLGYATMYNHSNNPNGMWIEVAGDLVFIALRDIADEEITHEYRDVNFEVVE